MKKILLFSFYFLLCNNILNAMSPDNEKKMYLGCYPQSKQYLGPERAKEYCLCTVNMLSKKYNDIEIDKLFNQSQEKIAKETEFATKHCEINKSAR